MRTRRWCSWRFGSGDGAALAADLPDRARVFLGRRLELFRFSLPANHRLIAPIPFQKRGRRPSSRTLERVAVDAFVSQASDIEAYGEVVWS